MEWWVDQSCRPLLVVSVVCPHSNTAWSPMHRAVNHFVNTLFTAFFSSDDKHTLPGLVTLAERRGVTRLDGARGKKQVWRPRVRTWMYCIEESACDIVGTSWRPGNCAPLVTPLAERRWFAVAKRKGWYFNRYTGDYSRITPSLQYNPWTRATLSATTGTQQHSKKSNYDIIQNSWRNMYEQEDIVCLI